MAEGDTKPTVGEWISDWLGVQLPSVPIPLKQTLKNLDKSISKVVLSAGENLESRIKANTGKVKARGTIDVEGMYQTADEKRKLESRVATTQAAMEELESNPGTEDAGAEIEDDWLNLFSRFAEDKSSGEMRRLFGKVLAGEIRKPGSFSFRTIQILSTLSKSDAELISRFLSFAFEDIVPFHETSRPEVEDATRLVMEELGIAGHPSHIGGMSLNMKTQPRSRHLVTATGFGLLVENDTPEVVEWALQGQILTKAARELFPIANSPPTKFEFAKAVADGVFKRLKEKHEKQIESRQLKFHLVTAVPVGSHEYRTNSIHMFT